MAKQKKEKKVSIKAEFRNTIKSKLEIALDEFKTTLGEKKFNNALKRGSKVLSSLLFVKKKKVKEKAPKTLNIAE